MIFKENQAIYKQIADHFCENILTRKWKPGDRIPSVREIAVNMEVNPNTAMRAFTYLQDQNIIFNKRGIGYFVSDEGYERSLEMRKEEFINNELPELFRSMEILGFKVQDMEKLYKDYLSKHKKSNQDENK